MPVFLGLSVIFQVICAVHIVRTGRSTTWLYIVLLFSGVGCLAYFVIEILPDLRHSRTGRAAVKTVLKTIDPQADLKKAARELRLSNNMDNKIKFAEQCIGQGLYADAEELYRSCLKGPYRSDPSLLLGLARTQFLQEQYAQTRATMDNLIAANPDFKSQDGHLLYARTLEALAEDNAALEEYKILARYYAGAEAKCRYALLLKKLGHTEQAAGVFQEILDYARDGPRFYRQAQKQWIDIARQNMG